MLAFVEYTTPDPQDLAAKWRAFGLKGNSDQIWFVSEGACLRRASLEENPVYLNRHGAGFTRFGLKVENSALILNKAKALGFSLCAKENSPEICLMGSLKVTLVSSSWEPPFKAEGRIQNIDHIALNVNFGTREKWCTLFESVFQFKRQKNFSIRGKKTGFQGSSLLSPCNCFRIVINESDEPDSQINSFIRDHRGEGLQHLAFSVKDIFSYVQEIRQKGIQLYETPQTYYEHLRKCLAPPAPLLKKIQISGLLFDKDESSDKEQSLFQIFTRPLLGSTFIEIIQRRHYEGFGERNITALFEAVERMQFP